MLNKTKNMYSELISRLPLSDLTALYERSKEYPPLYMAIEAEIDGRLSPKTASGMALAKLPSGIPERSLASANR
jgi:hypothetical protein